MGRRSGFGQRKYIGIRVDAPAVSGSFSFDEGGPLQENTPRSLRAWNGEGLGLWSSFRFSLESSSCTAVGEYPARFRLLPQAGRGWDHDPASPSAADTAISLQSAFASV